MTRQRPTAREGGAQNHGPHEGSRVAERRRSNRTSSEGHRDSSSRLRRIAGWKPTFPPVRSGSLAGSGAGAPAAAGTAVRANAREDGLGTKRNNRPDVAAARTTRLRPREARGPRHQRSPLSLHGRPRGPWRSFEAKGNSGRKRLTGQPSPKGEAGGSRAGRFRPGRLAGGRQISLPSAGFRGECAQGPLGTWPSRAGRRRLGVGP